MGKPRGPGRTPACRGSPKPPGWSSQGPPPAAPPPLALQPRPRSFLPRSPPGLISTLAVHAHAAEGAADVGVVRGQVPKDELPALLAFLPVVASNFTVPSLEPRLRGMAGGGRQWASSKPSGQSRSPSQRKWSDRQGPPDPHRNSRPRQARPPAPNTYPLPLLPSRGQGPFQTFQSSREGPAGAAASDEGGGGGGGGQVGEGGQAQLHQPLHAAIMGERGRVGATEGKGVRSVVCERMEGGVPP